jgi:type III pantothenate kinase
LTVLTIDLGNTRCKVRAWSVHGDGATRLAASEDLASDARLVDALRAWLAARAAPELAALSCVASAELEREVARTLRDACGERFLAELDSGLVNACREPASVGRDRLFAARGAFELVGASTLVLDAGTALTVDALEVDASSGAARFLGGAIAPGPTLRARALAAGTARLPSIEPRPGASALGRDTRGALEAGVVVGFRGAALELARAIGHESKIGAQRIVLTGGAKQFLLEPPLFERAPTVADELVHIGLLAAALDRPRAAVARRLRLFEAAS